MATEDKGSVPSEKKIGMTKHNGKRKWGKSVRKFIKRWKTLITILVTMITVFVAIAGLLWGVYQFKAQQSDSAQMQATQVAESAIQSLDQQRQATLDTYFDRLQELLLTKPDDFKAYKPGDEYQALAVARTLTALRNLDGPRKGYLIRFLWGAQLINAPKPILDVQGADLSGAVFAVPNEHINLSGVSLVNDILDGANLSGADLQKADLSGADLSNANLTGTYLSGAKLSNAHLSNAHLSVACLGSSDKCSVPTTVSSAVFPASQSISYATPTPSSPPSRSPPLSGADLSGTDLSNADLSGADLNGARYNTKPRQVTDAQGNILILYPTQWPVGFDPNGAGAICIDC